MAFVVKLKFSANKKEGLGRVGRGGTEFLHFDRSESVGQHVRLSTKALVTNKTTNMLKVGQKGTFGHDETKLNTWACGKKKCM